MVAALTSSQVADKRIPHLGKKRLMMLAKHGLHPDFLPAPLAKSATSVTPDWARSVVLRGNNRALALKALQHNADLTVRAILEERLAKQRRSLSEIDVHWASSFDFADGRAVSRALDAAELHSDEDVRRAIASRLRKLRKREEPEVVEPRELTEDEFRQLAHSPREKDRVNAAKRVASVAPDPTAS